MISAIGQALIVLALLVCAVGAPVGFVAGARRSAEGLRLTRRFALTFAALMVLANLVMEYALLTHDFSVKYVALVGSKATPTYITIVSLWSSLEGSILFWGLILGLYADGEDRPQGVGQVVLVAAALQDRHTGGVEPQHQTPEEDRALE